MEPQLAEHLANAAQRANCHGADLLYRCFRVHASARSLSSESETAMTTFRPLMVTATDEHNTEGAYMIWTVRMVTVSHAQQEFRRTLWSEAVRNATGI